MEKRRTREDILRIVKEFEQSGLKRRQFCERNNLPVTTLDYWRWKKAKEAKARLVPVAVRQFGIMRRVQSRASEWAAHRKPLEVSGSRLSATDPNRGKRLMFGLGPATKIYIAVEAVDMRKYAPSIVMWSRTERWLKSLGGRHWFSPTNCT